MDDETRKKLDGTVTKISVQHDSKMWVSSNGDKGYTMGGSFGFEMNIPPDANPQEQAVALWEYLKAVATEAVKPSMRAIQDAVKPKEAPAPVRVESLQEPARGPVSAPPSEPQPIPGGNTPGSPQRVLDIVADDTVQYKVLDSGKKLLLFKVGPFKLHGIDCWPEVAATWSELSEWTTWQPAQPFYVQSFGIRQIVVAMKPSKNDPNKMTPDKIASFR